MIRFTPQMLIEIAIFAIGIYAMLRFLRRTRGSGVVRGLVIVFVFVIVSFTMLIRSMHLERLEVVFQSLRDIAVVGLIIVFQPEIRRAIVQLGEHRLFTSFLRTEQKTAHRLLRAVARLAKQRTGALIAIEREASLAPYTAQGTPVDAEINSTLIESIFYPGSPMHDGAVLLRGDRIVAAGCFLPLSQNQDVDRRLGTRHRAALGLAEETDAVVIVVSEETGRVSVAVGGRIRVGIPLEELEHTIDQALGLEVAS